MKILNFILFLSFIFFQQGCKDTPNDPPPDNKPSGYQDDILWPSLGNSPWPANHYDMQRTGRSKYTGPLQGVILTKVPSFQMQTGVVFGSDSVFYYGTSDRGYNQKTKLVAAKIDGTIVWELDLNAIETTTTPLVDNTGTIYIANGFFKKIFAVNPNGTIKWSFQTPNDIWNDGLGIGKDGILYAIDNSSILYAIQQDGTLLWQYQDQKFGGGSRINLAFSPDGTTLYIHGNRVGDREITLVAFDLMSQTVKWDFGDKFLLNGPMVDSQGNIYVLIDDDTINTDVGNFYCLNPDGSIKWKFAHSRTPLYWDIDPTIDREGNIYIATDTLYALTYEGEIRWKMGLDGWLSWSPLICDNQGTVYLSTLGANFFDYKIMAISREGSIKWVIPVTDEMQPGQSPAISSSGLLIYPTCRSQNLLIIK